MKQKGVIRRIDSLGRLVIPREFRKAQKIKEGDPLEICLLENNDMLVRPINLSAKLIDAAKPIIKELSSTIENSVILADTENYIYASGVTFSELIAQPLNAAIAAAIVSRKNFIGEITVLNSVGVMHCSAFVIFADDVYGALIVFSKEPLDNWKSKTATMATNIIKENIQKF